MINQLKNSPKTYWYFLKRSVKGLIPGLLRSLPISSEKIGPPKGFYEETQSWICAWNSSKSRIKASYVEVHPRHQIDRLTPKTIYQNIHWQFRSWNISHQYDSPLYESPATFVAVIPGGRVYGTEGAVITPDDSLLADVSVDIRVVVQKNAKNHSVRYQWKLPPIHHLDKSLALFYQY